jgi:hypothetical protein
MDVANLIREFNARITMIKYQEEILPEDVKFGSSPCWLVEEEEPFVSEGPEKIIFVDSRRRRFTSIEVEGYVLLLTQIVTGAVLLENERCKPLFSPDEPPIVKLVLGVPDVIAKRWNIPNGGQVSIGNLSCDVAVGPTAKDATDSYMQEIERRTVERFLQDGLVVKDGAINFTTPAFQVDRGPLGLVKNIHMPYVDAEKFRTFGFMKKGQRSRCFATQLAEGEELLKMMSYLKLSDTPGLRGLVRIEAVVERDWFAGSKKLIFELFGKLCGTLVKVSDDSGLIPRTPEDTLPVVFLEKYLDRYFYNETYVRCAFIEAVKSPKNLSRETS